MIINTIGEYGCACGDYESDNLIAISTCRKSGNSPECSAGVAHLLKYKVKNEEGLREIGNIVNELLMFGGDCVVLVNDEVLMVNSL